MPEYRRAFVPGGTFFFTVVTHDRAPILLDKRVDSLFAFVVDKTRIRWPFTSDAYVVLPDHLHAIWSLPNDDHDFSKRWAYLKKEFTKAWLEVGGAEGRVTQSQQFDGRRGVWQRRFLEHLIRDETDFQRHVDYIHFNPVKHGLATCPHAWRCSSFADWVQAGVYVPDWQCVCSNRGPKPISFDDIASTARE